MSEKNTGKQYTPQENKGALFPNKNKVRDEQPDYSGVLFIPTLGGKVEIFGYSNQSKKQHIDYINIVSKEGELRGFLTRNPKFSPDKDKMPDWFGKLSLSLHGVMEVSGWSTVSKESRMGYISLSIRHYISNAEIDKWVEDSVLLLNQSSPQEKNTTNQQAKVNTQKTIEPTPSREPAPSAIAALRALQESSKN